MGWLVGMAIDAGSHALRPAIFLFHKMQCSFGLLTVRSCMMGGEVVVTMHYYRMWLLLWKYMSLMTSVVCVFVEQTANVEHISRTQIILV
jgi:hypothetical protein